MQNTSLDCYDRRRLWLGWIMISASRQEVVMEKRFLAMKNKTEGWI